MTDSGFPAARAAWRVYLERSAASARFVATLLVTATSVRFAIAGVQRALDVSRANFAELPVSHSEPPATRPGGAPGAPRPAAGKAAPSKASPPAVPPGQPRRMTLGVTFGPPRSDVYVNGRLVGQTPFLGDTSCKTGQPVRIEIVPARGVPLTYVRDCSGGAVEIETEPP